MIYNDLNDLNKNNDKNNEEIKNIEERNFFCKIENSYYNFLIYSNDYNDTINFSKFYFFNFNQIDIVFDNLKKYLLISKLLDSLNHSIHHDDVGFDNQYSIESYFLNDFNLIFKFFLNIQYTLIIDLNSHSYNTVLNDKKFPILDSILNSFFSLPILFHFIFNHFL
jgi:hypothetical protein